MSNYNPTVGTLLSVKVKCPTTKKMMTFKPEEIYWSHHEGECDLCGSHGEISFDFTCKYCVTPHKKPRPVTHHISISDW